MHKQRGISLIGMVLIGCVGGFFVLLGVKCIPAYTEYFGVKKAIAALIKESPNAPAPEIRAGFDRRGVIESFSSVSGENLDIEQTPAGTTISVAYDREVPVVANISLKIHFAVSESSGGNTSATAQ
jgi:hypothetical protein